MFRDDLAVCPECQGPLLRGSTALACVQCGWADARPKTETVVKASKIPATSKRVR